MEFFGQAESESERKSREKGRPAAPAPLAERMRPRDFASWIGHTEITGQGSFLSRLLAGGNVPSMILWGPPGCGKTTLAGVIAHETGMTLKPLSAVTSGIKEVKATIEEAREARERKGQRTILFIDEIHRFNKAQQDAFLPHVEDGTIILFGATTENPSFSIVSPLLSRCRVITMQALTEDDLVGILHRACETDPTLKGIQADESVLRAIASICDGDARRALNLMEQCAAAAPPDKAGVRIVDDALLSEISTRTHLHYDRSGEEHFNLISALHKSLRASDPQAALYWMVRMLESGDEPLYVGRRLVRFASEDVGLADPQALPITLAAVESYRMLGSPEGELALVEAVLYLATAPKSNALYTAYDAARAEVRATGSLPVPLHLRNAPTKLMKSIGYGKGYKYDHESEDRFSGQECLPEGIGERSFYQPGPFGFEREVAKRLEWWEKKRREISEKKGAPPG